MACDLTKLPSAPPSPDGLSITVADEPALLEPLTTEHRRQQHKGRSALSGLMPRRVWFFSASTGGQTVGGTVLILGAGVAGIYGVDVRPAFRRRGIGTALVHAALVQAREQLGQRTAVLSATGLGLGVYSRLGFREVCKLSFWKYGKLRQQKAPAQLLLHRILSGSKGAHP
jgi:ribosomal protein S18 acetylase RimI-like enzyme